MRKLLYLANARMPTEKAHGLQIAQMCEALGQVGFEVSLVVPARRNFPELQHVNVWDYYGVDENFSFYRLWCLDFMGYIPSRLAFMLYSVTFYLSVLFWLLGRTGTLYSRDPFLLWVLSWLYPQRRKIYEAHGLNRSSIGQRIQRRVTHQVDLAVAVTGYLAERLKEYNPQKIIVEHDGIQAKRFENMPSMEKARNQLNIDQDAFVIGYVGRLHTMGMDKGLGTLIQACAQAHQKKPDFSGELLIVGGPEEGLEILRKQWKSYQLDSEGLHAVGQVPAADVPLYLAACDVLVMSHPWTEFFAYYTSPLKLFEYMAAGRAILTTDMPVFREVLSEGETAIFVPPSDPKAMAEALMALFSDVELRRGLGEQAQAAVKHYTWQARAERINNALNI